ncbi:hypothetical protein J6590_045930 [Homalodisca vitripennis]|nr:hypothetical protein J6590_045930 [Homalodisca vitripennis]
MDDTSSRKNQNISDALCVLRKDCNVRPTSPAKLVREIPLYTRTRGGLAESGEFIEVVEMTLPQAKQVFCDGDCSGLNVPPGCLLGILWFFYFTSTQLKEL